MKMKRCASGLAIGSLMLCVGCTPERAAPPPLIVYNACPKVSLCPMPGSEPANNGDLSADIRRLELALTACAIKVETIKECQDKIDEESTQPAQSLN